MASFILSTLFSVTMGSISTVLNGGIYVLKTTIEIGIEYVETVSIFGFPVSNIPIMSSVLKGLKLLTMYDRIETEISSLREENNKLHSSIDELKNLNNSLRSELDNFRELQENLKQFAKEQQSDFHNVLENINDNFNRINRLLAENERVLLMKVAQDVEFLDNKEGLNEMEFKRFVNRIPKRLQSKFESLVVQKTEYKNLSTMFDNDANATVSPELIQTLIDDLCQNIDVES
eukprot:258425_1